MATNKNATIRYQALNRCFRNPGRQYYIEDLIEACNIALLDIDPSSTGIKRRQVFDDIKLMRDSQGFDAPIESYKDNRKAFYRYANLSFSINNQPLNEKEAHQLREGLNLSSEDKVDFERIKDKIHKNDGVMSFFNKGNSKDNIRDKFEEELDNILLDFVNTKLELYNKLSEDKVNVTMKRLWFNELYDQKVRGIAI